MRTENKSGITGTRSESVNQSKSRLQPDEEKAITSPVYLGSNPNFWPDGPTKGEGQTSEVEGVNNALRQRVFYLVRRGAAFARSEPVFRKGKISPDGGGSLQKAEERTIPFLGRIG